MSPRNQLDLDILPEEARKEIEDFYEFLLKSTMLQNNKIFSKQEDKEGGDRNEQRIYSYY